MSDKRKGVLAQHRDRMNEDDDYRKAALTAPVVVPPENYVDQDYPPATGKSTNGDGHGDMYPQVKQAGRQKSTADKPAGGIDASDTPASAPAEGDKYDDLTGEDLDKAVAEADIEGRSSMTADEKRQALRDRDA
jgi:hypothetical protein